MKQKENKIWMRITISPMGTLIKSGCGMDLGISIYFLSSLSDSNELMDWEESIAVPPYFYYVL